MLTYVCVRSASRRGVFFVLHPNIALRKRCGLRHCSANNIVKAPVVDAHVRLCTLRLPTGVFLVLHPNIALRKRCCSRHCSANNIVKAPVVDSHVRLCTLRLPTGVFLVLHPNIALRNRCCSRHYSANDCVGAAFPTARGATADDKNRRCCECGSALCFAYADPFSVLKNKSFVCSAFFIRMLHSDRGRLFVCRHVCETLSSRLMPPSSGRGEQLR